MKIFYVIPILLMFGCATAPTVPAKVYLGMDKHELISKCGQPFQKSAKGDEEVYTYSELIYDTPIGNWWMTKSDRSSLKVKMKNGKVVQIGD